MTSTPGPARHSARIWALLPVVAAVLGSILPTSPSGSAEPGVRGEIELPDVSGAAALPGGRLLLTSSEGTSVLIPDAANRLAAGRILVAPGERLDDSLRGRAEVADPEDAAGDANGHAYLVGSHARTALGDAPDARYRIARVKLDPGGKVLEALHSGGFLEALLRDLPFLADAIRRPPARAGLNIEGLACSPEGELVIGLRAPTITESARREHGGQEDAVVVRVVNPDALFVAPPQPASLAEVVKLDLRGQGIRGMCFDPVLKAYWLVSGLSVEPTHPVRGPWGLWLWDGRGAPRSVPVPGSALEQPTAVCRITTPAGDRLLLVEAGTPASPYLMLPVPTPP